VEPVGLFQQVQLLEFKTGRYQSTRCTCTLLILCDFNADILMFWVWVLPLVVWKVWCWSWQCWK